MGDLSGTIWAESDGFKRDLGWDAFFLMQKWTKNGAGGGLVFGPYFIRNRPYNAAEYVRLLRDEVFPDIHGVIGGAAFNAATWMQVCSSG